MDAAKVCPFAFACIRALLSPGWSAAQTAMAAVVEGNDSEVRMQTEAQRKAKDAANKAAWRKANPEAHRAQQALYRKRHPERDRAKAKNWYLNNLEKRRALRHRRRAMENNSEGYFTPEEWLSLCQVSDYRCLSCHKKKPLSPDHVIPISKGGTSWINNIQPLCDSCNKSKGTKIIDYRSEIQTQEKTQ